MLGVIVGDACGVAVRATTVGLVPSVVVGTVALGHAHALSASAPAHTMACHQCFPHRGVRSVVELGVFMSNICKSSCKDQHQHTNHDDYCQSGLSCGGNGNIPDQGWAQHK